MNTKSPSVRYQVTTTTIIFNPLRAKFVRRNKNIYLHFMSFLHIDMRQVVEIHSQVKQEPTYRQYHGCRCPGDARGQGISNHDIYYVESDQFGPRTLRINQMDLLKQVTENGNGQS